MAAILPTGFVLFIGLAGGELPAGFSNAVTISPIAKATLFIWSR